MKPTGPDPADELSSWLAQEAEQTARLQHAPSASPFSAELRASMDGLAQAMRAIGSTILVSGQTATAEAPLFGADGKLYAHDTTTSPIFPLPAANPT